MAIVAPTIPSSLTSISAVELKPTQNNKAFYINSGVISADNTETTVISVDSVGKRDIILWINVINATISNDSMRMKVKNNGSIIYETIYMDKYDTGPPTPVCFIIPANTNIEVTFTNSDSSPHDVGVSAYGYYL